MKKLIVTITLCLAFLQASVWWAWGTFRRSADDLVKINQSLPVDNGANQCIQAGGLPSYWNGQFTNCGKK